ncbi:hypothetical protein K8I28_12390 [bacterium]|nr:hypothetical protein [bacterium]
MTETQITLLRMVLAGINGILFVAGWYIVFEMLKKRPRRLKKRLMFLVLEVEKMEEDIEDDSEIVEGSTEKRREIDLIKRKLNNYNHDIQNLLPIAFGVLMIVVAIFAILSLLTPGFTNFI